jgi:glutamine synthetase
MDFWGFLMHTREEVLEKAKEERVKFLRLQFTDTFGSLKNIAVTSEDLERAMAGRISFDSSAVDGVIGGLEQDILLRPDLSTFIVFPWRPRDEAVARFICDIANPDGSPYRGCSRSVLKQVLEEAAQMGFDVWMGAKVGFYLLHTDNKGNPTINTHDQAGLCDLTPFDLGENARRDIVLTLEEMGYSIGYSHHEAGPGQHKVSMKHCPPWIARIPAQSLHSMRKTSLSLTLVRFEKNHTQLRIFKLERRLPLSRQAADRAWNKNPCLD